LRQGVYTLEYYTTMQHSAVSGSRAGYLNKFNPANLPQQTAQQNKQQTHL